MSNHLLSNSNCNQSFPPRSWATAQSRRCVCPVRRSLRCSCRAARSNWREEARAHRQGKLSRCVVTSLNGRQWFANEFRKLIFSLRTRTKRPSSHTISYLTQRQSLHCHCCIIAWCVYMFHFCIDLLLIHKSNGSQATLQSYVRIHRLPSHRVLHRSLKARIMGLGPGVGH